LKTRLERYFTETGSHHWIDVLEDFTNNLNHSINRTIKMAPVNVTLENAPRIFKQLHPNMKKPKDCKLKIGDIVRLAIEGNIFTKVLILFYTLML